MPDKSCDGAQMANFWRFLASCISSEPRAAHFRPAFQIRTKAASRGSMVDIQSATAENRREKKKERRRNYRGKIECPHLLRRAAITRMLYGYNSGMSTVRVSCKRTELKRCIAMNMRWNK